MNAAFPELGEDKTQKRTTTRATRAPLGVVTRFRHIQLHSARLIPGDRRPSRVDSARGSLEHLDTHAVKPSGGHLRAKINKTF